ncbi:unnamed protein product, partial [Allacma fusca]
PCLLGQDFLIANGFLRSKKEPAYGALVSPDFSTKCTQSTLNLKCKPISRNIPATVADNSHKQYYGGAIVDFTMDLQSKMFMKSTSIKYPNPIALTAATPSSPSNENATK